MDWLSNKVMMMALIAALGLMSGTSIYNSRTERELLTTEKQILDSIKSGEIGNNLQKQSNNTPDQNDASLLKQIEQHLANIDTRLEQNKKVDEQDTAHFQKYFKVRQLPAGAGKGYGPNDIH